MYEVLFVIFYVVIYSIFGVTTNWALATIVLLLHSSSLLGCQMAKFPTVNLPDVSIIRLERLKSCFRFLLVDLPSIIAIGKL